jgi:hypothetical protein
VKIGPAPLISTGRLGDFAVDAFASVMIAKPAG